MNYYIQGNPTRAEQIKAAFQELGINVLDFGFADKTVVYCSIGECVQYLPYSINLMNILYSHPDYQELSLTVKSKPKFKTGTWLWHKTKGVFPMMVEDYDEKEGYLMQFTDGVKCYFGRDIIENDYRLWNFGDSKPGDILYDKAYNRIGIFENFGHHPDGGSFNDKTYCYLIIYYDIDDKEIYEKTFNDMDGYDAIPATKEQRDLLFAMMRESGYEWDAYKKEVKKLPKHYDISNFQPFDEVLVRDKNDCYWEADFFSRIITRKDSRREFKCVKDYWKQCIPFNEKTKHLLGTTNPCDERYVNW